MQDEDEEGAEDGDERMTEVRAGGDADAGEAERAEGMLQPQDIDAFWLQRRIAGAFPTLDAAGAQKLAEQVFFALQVTAQSSMPAGIMLSCAGIVYCVLLQHPFVVGTCKCQLVKPACRTSVHCKDTSSILILLMPVGMQALAPCCKYL